MAEKVRVLVVDDELTIRNLLAEMLRIAGFDPEIKEIGSAALAAIRSNSFDVALFDVNMPGMN